MREPRSLELRISKPRAGSPNFTPWSLQQATFIPLIAENIEDDDAEMAGIIRSQTPRIHRLWSRPLLKERREDIHLSSTATEARKHVHRSVLRRLIRRPPLERTRSLFVMPTMKRAADETRTSGWMPARISAQPVAIVAKGPGPLAGIDTAKFMAERRHRRCHSEQPRSWREPSASLWPLQEDLSAEGGTP